MCWGVAEVAKILNLMNQPTPYNPIFVIPSFSLPLLLKKFIHLLAI